MRAVGRPAEAVLSGQSKTMRSKEPSRRCTTPDDATTTGQTTRLQKKIIFF